MLRLSPGVYRGMSFSLGSEPEPRKLMISMVLKSKVSLGSVGLYPCGKGNMDEQVRFQMEWANECFFEKGEGI